jgi:hypothetical protein
MLCSGYLPPEFIEHNVISKMFDIFSLGVVMIKIIAGPSGRTKSAEMPRDNFIDQVRNVPSYFSLSRSMVNDLKENDRWSIVMPHLPFV